MRYVHLVLLVFWKRHLDECLSPGEMVWRMVGLKLTSFHGETSVVGYSSAGDF